jgi:hypothetical protein
MNFVYFIIVLLIFYIDNKYKELKTLPMTLRHKVAMKIHANYNKTVKLFEFAEESFIRDICTSFKPMLCLQRDYVIQQYEIAEKMYFIVKGNINLT